MSLPFSLTLLKKIVSCSFILLSLLILGVSVVSAATTEYIPLTGLPGVTDTATNKDLAGYINALFIISISLGGMLAVVKIAFAGFKYMLTDNIGGKGEARKDITGALLGLLILVSTFVVLSTIYPNLTSLQVLSNAETLDLKFASTTPQDFGCQARERFIKTPAHPEGECIPEGGKAPFKCGGGDLVCFNKCVVEGGELERDEFISIFEGLEEMAHTCRFDTDVCSGNPDYSGCKIAAKIQQCIDKKGEYVWVGPYTQDYECQTIKKTIDVNAIVASFSTAATPAQIQDAISSYDPRYADEFIGVYNSPMNTGERSYWSEYKTGEAGRVADAINASCKSKGGVLLSERGKPASRTYCFGEFTPTPTEERTETIDTRTMTEEQANAWAEEHCMIDLGGYVDFGDDINILTCYYSVEI